MPERVKEKLVELIGAVPCNGNGESLGSCPDRKYGLCGEVANLSCCVIQNTVNHLIAQGVTVQEWISVKDRLPEDDLLPDCSQKYIRVITFIKRIDGAQTVDIHHRIKMSDDGTWEWMNFSSPGTITHWMPIPELPKDSH